MWLWLWRINKAVQDTERGYVIPLSASRGVDLAGIAIVMVLLWLWGTDDPAITAGTKVLLLGGTALLLQMAVKTLAKLHIAPEGMKIVLFGRMIHYFPAGRIWLITAIQHRGYRFSKGPELLAVCEYSLRELTALGIENTPKLFRSTRPELWEGEIAQAYLVKRGTASCRNLNRYGVLWWLDWDPKRVEMLREMYPHAQWLDCTQDKRYDKQLTK